MRLMILPFILAFSSLAWAENIIPTQVISVDTSASDASIEISPTVIINPTVLFQTNFGSFTVELNIKDAPHTVTNFMRYIDDGSYINSQFHRIIPGFMIQGGGFDKSMKKLPTYDAINNEAHNGLENLTATIAMARTNNPDSATRQFFINLIDNKHLNYEEGYSDGYAVFGKVTQGFGVIEQIAQLPIQSVNNMANVPIQSVIITNVSLINK